jgi:hypothetical protein
MITSIGTVPVALCAEDRAATPCAFSTVSRFDFSLLAASRRAFPIAAASRSVDSAAFPPPPPTPSLYPQRAGHPRFMAIA